MENCAIYDLGPFTVCGAIDTGLTYPSSDDFLIVIDGPHGRKILEVTATAGAPIVIDTSLNEYAIYYVRVKVSGGDLVTFTISGSDYEILKIETSE